MKKNPNKTTAKRTKKTKPHITTTGFSEVSEERLQEMDRIAKMLVRRDFDLMEMREKREAELKELRKTRIELEEAKTTLEAKVKERTQELENLTQTLETQVKQRTRELQDKLKELERMNKHMIGRELKMVELKKEIKKLKRKLEEYKSD